MEIRPVAETDRAEWLRMRRAIWPDADPDELAAEVDGYFRGERGWLAWLLAETVFVCAREEGGLRGFVEVSIRPYAEGATTDRIGYIEGWYVDPDARRTGVGRALVAAAESWARAQGCTEMGSDVLFDNTISQAAHGRLGYREVERLVLYLKALE